MPPAAIAAVGIGAGLAGASGGAAANVGKTKGDPGNFRDNAAYDENRYEYGGQKSLGNVMAARYNQASQDNRARASGLYGQAEDDYKRSLDARNRAGGAADMMMARAQGRDLISSRIAAKNRREMDNNLSSMRASARGPQGLALAQQDSMAAAAQGGAAINYDESVAAMQEQQAAEQAAYQAYTGMRQGDLSSREQGLGAGAQAENLGIGWAGQEQRVREKQTDANLRQQEVLSGSQRATDELDSANDRADANREWDYMKMAVGGTQGGAQMAGQGATSDPLAKVGVSPLSGPGNADGFGSLAEHSGYGTRFGSNAGASPFASDPEIKTDMKNFSGESPYSKRESRSYGPPAPSKSGPKKAPKRSAADLSKQADDMMASMRAGMDAPPAVGPNAAPRGKMSDAEASRLSAQADDWMSGMRAGMDAGPAVGPNRGLSDGERAGLAGLDALILEQQNQQAAMGAPSAVQSALDRPPPDMPGAIGGPEEERALQEQFIAENRSPEQMGPMAERDRSLLRKARNEYDPDMWEPFGFRRSRGDREPSTSDPAAKAQAFQLGQQKGAAAARGEDGSLSMPEFESVYGKKAVAKAMPDRESKMRKLAELGGEGVSPKEYAEIMGEAELQRAMPSNKSTQSAGAQAQRPTDAIGFSASRPPSLEQVMAQARSMDEAERGDLIGAGASMQDNTERRTMSTVSRPAGRARYQPPPSDPKTKRAASKLGGSAANEVAETLDAVPGVSYRYKDPYFEDEAQRPGERQAGFLTSDLKKTPLGAAVVEKRSDGYEGYNQHRMTGLQQAEIANLHERLRDLESELVRARGGRRGRVA